MKKLLILALYLLPGFLFAQPNSAGKIKYDYSRDWLKRIEKDKFMSNEDKQRALQTWKNDEAYTLGTELTFNQKGSYYAKAEDERGGSWRKTEYWVYRDFDNARVLESQDIAGKVYIVDDSLYTYPWKIKNEIKEVAGQLCMLATTYDSLRNFNVEAWFTTAIPANIGPENFQGLPGAILQLNIDEGVAMITATKIDFNPSQELPPLPKKIRGKRYTKAEYDKALNTYIKDMNEAKRMPWGLRY